MAPTYSFPNIHTTLFGKDSFFSFLNSNYLNPDYWYKHTFPFVHDFFVFISSQNTISLFKAGLTFLAIFFISVMCYSFVRLLEIREKEHAHLHHEIEEYNHKKAEEDRKQQEENSGSKNERWSKVLKYLFSSHESDWKLAIIEADAMLEILLDQMGFKGESLGDKLKSAHQDTFRNLTLAWEVHTIRNRIAHEGSSFLISQHEAKRVIALYEQIFHGYGFI